jgi:hemin uptake protein HemP
MPMTTLSLSQDLPPQPSVLVAMKTARTATPRIASQRLLDGSRELVIEHQGSEYHLRLTRNDKLILTK